ncbi:ATP-binding protein [Tundrisphaera sp. TA3]|uniref:ATP-binding protein n=1 Tax=Tundrisphaera sp. TA3 TaxID=3435775 RepID=UPI003EB73853
MRRWAEFLPRFGFLSAVVVLLANTLVTVETLTRLGADNQTLSETREFLRAVSRVRILFAAESGPYLFAETGDRGALEYYQRCDQAIDAEIANASRMGEHILKDARDVDELLGLLQVKRDELARLIRSGPGEPGAKIPRDGRTTERARELLRSIDQRVDAFYRQTSSDSLMAVRKAGVSFTLASALAVLLLGLAFHRDQRDAHRRERAAAMVRQHERWLAATVESIGDGVIATDPRGNVLLVNPAAEALIGYAPAELIGRPIAEVFRLIDEETRRPVESLAARVARDGRGEQIRGVAVLVARDGRETTIEDIASPIRGEQGNILGVVKVFRDVGRQRREEAERDRLLAEARVARQRLQDLVMQAPAMIVTTRGPGHLVDLINPTSLASFGREDAAGIVGRSLEGLFPEADRGEIRAIMDRVYAEGGRHAVDEQPLRLFRPGTSTPYQATARVVFLPTRDAAGSIDGILIHAVEVTEQIEARRSLERLAGDLREARDAAEEANRSKDRFLAVLSHELRTPLNPILLAVSAMLEKSNPPAELRSLLVMIRRNVELEARLIDDLLDVMGILRGKMALQWGIADAHNLIGEALTICHGEIAEAGLRVILDLEARERTVNADPARLQQVFWNLIKNAVKFTPAGGTIRISTRNEHGEPGKAPGFLAIEVADTGIGIEPEVLPLIFEPFRQGESSLNRRYGGLGLGLAIGRSVIEAHGGSLAAGSEGKGRGSTFTVRLPSLAFAPDAPADPPTSDAPADGPLKLLLVEDDIATLRVLSRLLRGMAHRVTTADTLQDALAAFDADSFDLVISDIGLPDGSGIDLIRAIRRRDAVPAVALTGYGMQEDIQRCRDAGFSAHLTKPIDFRKLEVVIREVMA